MKILLTSLILLSSCLVLSKTEDPDLKKILSRIRQSPLVTFQVEKKTKSELLGKETISPGKIYVSPKKFRWDSEGNENSKIIYDGHVIWTIQEPPKGFKAPPQITKMKIDKKSESQIFLNNLFQEKFNSQFKLTKKEKINKAWSFYLKPLQKSLGIDELIIKITSKNDLSEISYIDEIKNKIVISISKTTLSSKANAKLFQFKPPTGAQVNEL